MVPASGLAIDTRMAALRKIARAPGPPELNKELVKVGGHGWQVDFILDDLVPCDQLLEAVRRHLSESNCWFAGGPVRLNVGRRVTRPGELVRLRAVFEDEFQLAVVGFLCGVEALERHISDEVGVDVELLRGHPAADVVEAESSPGDETLVVKSTCRSGTSINHEGDVVVLGDVNPGAEVIATGDIVVLGTLRGIAHAGTGDVEPPTAVIVATTMRPLQLRIGRHVSVASEEERGRATIVHPEIAYVSEDSIIVAPFTGWFQRTQDREGI